MAIHFYRKTNKKANNIFQMKTQIRMRAEELRRQQSTNSSVVHFGEHIESEIFSKFGAPPQYMMVGKEHPHEHN